MNPLRAGLVISVVTSLANDAFVYYLATYGDDYIAVPPRMLLAAALLLDSAVDTVRCMKNLCVTGTARRAQLSALWRRLVPLVMGLWVVLAFVAVSYGLGFFLVAATINLAIAAWYFFRDDDGWPTVRRQVAKAARSFAASLRPGNPVPAGSSI